MNTRPYREPCDCWWCLVSEMAGYGWTLLEHVFVVVMGAAMLLILVAALEVLVR